MLSAGPSALRCIAFASWLSSIFLLSSSPSTVSAFAPTSLLPTNTNIKHTHPTKSLRSRTKNNKRQITTSPIFLSSNTNEDDEATKLRKQARRIKLEAEKLEATLNLEKIHKLEKALTNGPPSKNTKDNAGEDIKLQIQSLVDKIDPSLRSSLPGITSSSDRPTVPTAASGIDESKSEPIETNLYRNRTIRPLLSERQLTEASEYYASLPEPLRRAMAESVGLDDGRISPAVVVLALYESGDKIDEAVLRNLYRDILKQGEEEEDTSLQPETKTTKDRIAENLKGTSWQAIDPKSEKVFDVMDRIDGTSELESMVDSILPRVTRKEGRPPTLTDVTMLMDRGVLGKETFQTSEPPQSIPGGYILRGTISPMIRRRRGEGEEDDGTMLEDGDELLRRIDGRIGEVRPEWLDDFQVSYMFDPTPRALDDEMDLNGDAVLFVSSNDFSPTASRFLSSGTTAISLFLSLVFAVSTFANNKVVMDRLMAANTAAVQDYDLSWFNELIYPFIIAVGVTQAAHEAAHLYFAKKDGFKISPPTVLPLLSLPYMSFQTKLKTSPKNLNSLFNFAFSGPAVGMVVSMGFLLAGLQLTLNMDAAALEYAPSVPVFFLRLSSLGGSIVDYVLGGGDGIILNQDPTTPVPLHPFAIGGFAAFMINALDTIPIGSTDGGRISQSLLGRKEHVAFSAIVYGALLIYTALSGHREVFLAFLLINGFSQKDTEVPCRNEVDKGGLGQAASALVLWSVAILALTPMG